MSWVFLRTPDMEEEQYCIGFFSVDGHFVCSMDVSTQREAAEIVAYLHGNASAKPDWGRIIPQPKYIKPV